MKTVLLLIGFILASIQIAEAQQPNKMPRIGALHLGTASAAAETIDAFQRGLRALGYVEGSTILVDYRYAEGKTERHIPLAAELGALKPAVIVVWGTDVAAAVKKTTATVPTVFALADRPDILGLVDSLARPGGNLTGLTTLNFELTTKRLELLKESIPELTRVALLGMHHPLIDVTLRESQPTAKSFGIQLQAFELNVLSDLENLFSQLSKSRPGALLLLPSREAVYAPSAVSLALNHRLPTIASQIEITAAGGLMSYGPRLTEMSFRAATYVDKILRGAKPSDLPVEQPTTFDLAINLKIANQIGLTIPPNVLARADKVIK